LGKGGKSPERGDRGDSHEKNDAPAWRENEQLVRRNTPAGGLERREGRSDLGDEELLRHLPEKKTS